MTFKILKSAFDADPNFAIKVQAYAAERRTWKEHMGRVAADEAAGVTGIAKHVAYGSPTASSMIMESVNEAGDPDFYIFDDGPTTEQALEIKKLDLYNRLIAAQTAAINEVGSAVKRRLWDLKENEVYDRDGERIATAMSKDTGWLAKLVGRKSSVAEETQRSRSAEDAAHIAEQTKRRRKINAIVLIGAQAHSDIEDLTVDNVDAWKLPDFTV